ncbi:outer membrane lipoprotein-sorting protein [Marivirga salinae]|uniref:Outer membrane lipoprotein-sorting protein n=1 Tax=Marivirga salinarum TaxID=3059078 RepID=A0AA49GBX1_9BACT|nr:outer membrane lipoprotein-sorting protein [Marivirga sp. BDSF4-3]WKK76304.1 outer membrane lipoprotein-sorting protein [Marivirga sp. BDSF4-3]
MRNNMKIWLLTLIIPFNLMGQSQLTADEILQKVDENISSNSTITESKMVIHGRRNTREIVSKGYAEGNEKAFTEYLAPEREKGTKMLKLEDKLWIYNPSTDRTIQLSGHMLRQSVMGSDLSYEDLMEDRQLTDIYDAQITGEEVIDNRKCWILELNATVEDASYQKRKTWIDQERFVPLKEELYAKSGQLLKQITMKNVEKIAGRWYPKNVNYKDVLKEGEGTDFIVLDIQFNPEIPDYIFNKASLKR